MDIKRSGSQPSGKGQAEYFTGSVRIDPLSQAPAGPDPDRDGWLRTCKELGRPGREDSARGFDLVPARGKALA